MGVYIKGMEMPTSCAGCFNRGCGLGREVVLPSHQRHKYCPLVPVPPHGDLIDQDGYRDEFMDGVYDLCNDDPDNNRANAIIDLFDFAPTIIPAEEETNGRA